MMTTHCIETRYHQDACNLRDLLIDAGFDPSEIPSNEERMHVETGDVRALISVAIACAESLSIALWVDGIRSDYRGRVTRQVEVRS